MFCNSRAKSHVVLSDQFVVAGARGLAISASAGAFLGRGQRRVLLQLVGLLADTGEGIVAVVGGGCAGEAEAGASAAAAQRRAAEAPAEADARRGAAQGVVLDQTVAAAEELGAAVLVAVPPRRGRRQICFGTICF